MARFCNHFTSMNNTHNWNIFEKLAAPDTPAGERIQLLKFIESNADLLAQWKAFRVLQEWPLLEQLSQKSGSTDVIMMRVHEVESVDYGIKRNFPWVAAAALAASVVLVLINIGQKEDASDVTLDDVFGLPAPTIENTVLANL